MGGTRYEQNGFLPLGEDSDECDKCRGTGEVTTTLAHLYHGKRGFVQEPDGVDVTEAGLDAVNGLYSRKEYSDGPPKYWPRGLNWERNFGQHFYEKDDGCYIYLHEKYRWWICTPCGAARYYNDGRRRPVPPAPPAQGWSIPWGYGRAPAPTLRVTP